MSTTVLQGRQLADTQLSVAWEIHDQASLWLTVIPWEPIHLMGEGDGTDETAPLTFNIKQFGRGWKMAKQLAKRRGQGVYFTATGSRRILVEYP